MAEEREQRMRKILGCHNIVQEFSHPKIFIQLERQNLNFVEIEK